MVVVVLLWKHPIFCPRAGTVYISVFLTFSAYPNLHLRQRQEVRHIRIGIHRDLHLQSDWSADPRPETGRGRRPIGNETSR